MQLFANINWNFLKYKYIILIVCGVCVLVSIISLLAHGGPRWGIDFTGGRVVDISFGSPPDIGRLRDVLSKNGFGSIEVQSVKGNPWIMFRVPTALDNQFQDFTATFLDLMRSNFTEKEGYKIEVLSDEKVGPKIGAELRVKAIKAVILALVAMLIYITVRFQFRFGIVSIIALCFDVIIALGIFSLLDKEFTVQIVAAFLTIVGYSINDKIVVSDRIRENMGKLRRMNFSELVNRSINQTFTRTVITSLTTLIVLVAIMLLGGTVIFDFAFALFIGVTVGTFSSMFIMSPLSVIWEQLSPKKVSAPAR